MTGRRALPLAMLLMLAVTAWGQLSINPTSLPTTPFPVGQVFPAQQLSVPAPFQNDTLVWSISAGNLPPGLTLSAVGAPPGSITGTPTQAGAFLFTAKVLDNSGPVPTQATRQYTLYISLGTPLSLSPLTPPPAAVGASYAGSAFQAGGGVPGYIWALQSGTNADGLGINGNTGQLSGIPLAGGVFSIAVVLTDASGAQTSATFNLNVLGVSTTSLPGATLGSGYSQTVAAVGGTGTLSWLVTGRSLPPPGLTLSSQGQITGVATASGTFPFVVQVTDSATTLSASQALSITVAAATTISPATLPNGVVNIPYTAPPLTLSGVPNVNWAVTVGTLPAGLNLNPSTGVIGGTPTAAGSSTFTISATPGVVTAALPPVTQVFMIVINAAPTVTITGLPSIGVAATQASSNVTLSGTYPLLINVTMALTFSPKPGVTQNYDAKFATGNATMANFTIPPGSAAASAPVIILGTVAGTITITTSLQDSAGNILAPPAPTVITVSPSAPVITNITFNSVNPGFTISVTGYSTPRDMASVLLHFTPSTTGPLTTTDFTISLTGVFPAWYNSSASIAFGSQFTMTVPFTFTHAPGTTIPCITVTATLTNSTGSSSPSSTSCQAVFPIP